MVTDEQKRRFHEDGYLIWKGMFDGEETQALASHARGDTAYTRHAVDRDDGDGGKSRLTLWTEQSDDLFGLVARSERVAGSAEELLGEEVYLWHAKLMQKDARGGGAWVWHQDYGYWYMDACLYPDLVSCYIALDPATRQNGCLQVLKGSHRLGRLDHGPVAGQTGADPGRVALAAEELEHVYCEMAPGDGLFFHANTLHRSDRNTSDTPRWGLICCYNTKTNTPRGETFQPSYNPLRRVPDTAIKEAARAPDPTADRQFME